MNAEAILALSLHDEVAPAPRPVQPSAGGAAMPFADRLAQELQSVNERLLSTQTDLQGLALGRTENLHEVMVRLEESRLSLQLMLQVRNRVLEAYQDILRMQV